MKKLFFIPLMLLTTLIMITACNEKELLSERQEQTSPVENENEGAGENVNGSNRRYLILYCSRTGNTEQMARTIQSILNCDMIVVEPETAYEEDYNAMLDRAQAELDDIAQGNYPKSPPQWKVSTIMTSYLSAILYGSDAWLHRCKHFCTIMLIHCLENISLFLPPVEVAA